MPAAPRKTAAQRAAAEAAPPKPPAITVQFRGEKFEIPNSRLTSARFIILYKANDFIGALVTAIGPEEELERFLAQCEPEDQIEDVAREFADALNAAAGTGNS